MQERREFFCDTITTLRGIELPGGRTALSEVTDSISGLVERIFARAKTERRTVRGNAARTNNLIRMAVMDALVHGQYKSAGGDPVKAAHALYSKRGMLDDAYADIMATIKERFAEFGDQYRDGLTRIYEHLKKYGDIRYGIAEYGQFHEVVGTTITPYERPISERNGFFSTKGLDLFDPETKELIPERLTDRAEHAQDILRYALALEHLPKDLYEELQKIYERGVPAKRIKAELGKSGIAPAILLGQIPLLQSSIRSMILAEVLYRENGSIPTSALLNRSDISKAAGVLREQFARHGAASENGSWGSFARALQEIAERACERFIATVPADEKISEEREFLDWDTWVAEEFRKEGEVLLKYGFRFDARLYDELQRTKTREQETAPNQDSSYAHVYNPTQPENLFQRLEDYVQSSECIEGLWKIDLDKAIREMESTMRDDPLDGPGETKDPTETDTKPT